ncbi:MAG TPA: antibiotic biosynthesis monooxygenase [Nocardioides sp.]|uniref:antibiotic biosynthesis monooxygenase family protein n=1 Tax=Nocardioides sp. TaxID=35761 RepID=UPI002F3E9E38
MTTVITVYDVPDGAPAPTALAEGHTLHRAVGMPAAYPWIDLGEAATAEDAALLVASAAGRPGALAGRYEAFHVNDQAAPAYDPDRHDESVIFVNCMRFAPERHDAAFAAWERVNHYMVRKPGYRWHRLHRRLDDDAPFGLVNVVEWESPDAWRAAHDDGFRALAGGDLPFTAQPTLCRAVSADEGVAR